MKVSKKTTIEYEQAPSGAIMLYNYKEPFMEFKNPAGGESFGYQGVLMMDAKKDVVQCHFCGEWFNVLWHHIRREHNMNVSQYKKAVGLNQTTALMSESARHNMMVKNVYHPPQFKRFMKKGHKKSKAQLEKMRKASGDITREKQNTRGTCPLQLKERYWKLKEKLGRQPVSTDRETWSMRMVATKIFGSWSNFVKECGDSPRDGHEERIKFGAVNKAKMIHDATVFYKAHKRLPSRSDFRRGFMDGSVNVYYNHKKEIKNLLLTRKEK